MELTLSNIVTTLITILLVSLAIHFGAKPFARKEQEKFLNAVLVAVLGSIIAGFVWVGLTGVLPGLWPQVIALAAWALIAAVIYRTSWIRGLLIGVFAWVIWFLVGLLFDLLFG